MDVTMCFCKKFNEIKTKIIILQWKNAARDDWIGKRYCHCWIEVGVAKRRTKSICASKNAEFSFKIQKLNFTFQLHIQWISANQKSKDWTWFGLFDQINLENVSVIIVLLGKCLAFIFTKPALLGLSELLKRNRHYLWSMTSWPDSRFSGEPKPKDICDKSPY